MHGFDVEPEVEVFVAFEFAGLVQYTLQLAHPDSGGDWILEKAIQPSGKSSDPAQPSRYSLGKLKSGDRRRVVIDCVMRTPETTGSVKLGVKLFQLKGDKEKEIGGPEPLETEITDGKDFRPPTLRLQLTAVSGTLR